MATKKRPPKASLKGKRYSPAERKTIIAFVEQVNAKKGGRGGLTAASKKYKVSPLSISNWMKQGGGSSAPKRRGRKAKAARGGGGDALDQLVALRAEINDLKSDLAAKEAQFDKLKKKL